MGKKHRNGQPRIGVIVLSGIIFIGWGLMGELWVGVPQASAQTTATVLNTIAQKEDYILGAIHALPAPPPPMDLSGVTQSWSKALPAAQRFVVLAAFANAAVLDKNTGLVWERAPSSPDWPWFFAVS